jgi:hypothetical protein
MAGHTTAASRDERLSDYLISTVVDSLDHDFDDPEFEHRKVQFMLQSFAGDTIDIETVSTSDGQVDAYRIQEDDGEGRTVLEIWQLSGPGEDALRKGRVSIPPANKLKHDILGLAATLQGGKRNLSADGVDAVRALREELIRAREGKRDLVVKLSILSLYDISDKAKALASELANESLSSLMGTGRSLIVETTIRGLADYAAAAGGEFSHRPSLGFLRLELASAGAYARHADAILAFVKPNSLLDFYRKHQAALLHTNARFHLGNKKSTANPEIAKSAKNREGARYFHELNNGIVITCTKLSPVEADKNHIALQIRDPQVVNGGQTVHTLTEVAKGIASGKASFVNELVLPVKIVRIPSSDEASDAVPRATQIAIASNTQAALSARALASYVPTNQRLQRAFAKLTPSWFFEKTDGEWPAFRQKRVAKTHRFKVTGVGDSAQFELRLEGQRGTTPRRIINVELLEALLSAYGCFEEAKPKRVFDEHVHPAVLNYSFTATDWRNFGEREAPSGSYEALIAAYPGEKHQTPPVRLFLLTWILFRSVRALVLSEARAKEWARETWHARGWSRKPFATVDEWAAYARDTPRADAFEWTEHIANAMQKPLVFECTRLLTTRYGPLTESTCGAILRLPQFERLASGESPKRVLSVDHARGAKIGETSTPVYTLFQLCRQACLLLFVDRGEAIRVMGTKQQTLLGAEWVAKLSRQLDSMTGDLDSHSSHFITGTKIQPAVGATLYSVLPDLGELAEASTRQKRRSPKRRRSAKRSRR